MEEKKCTKCGKVKPPSEFNKDKQIKKDGRRPSCRDCQHKEDKEYYLNNKNSVNERSKQWRFTHLKERRIYNKKYRKEHHTREAVYIKFKCAVIRGKLLKKPCEVCGSTNRIHGHHPDYLKPLDVKWLCSQHHREEHNRLKSLLPVSGLVELENLAIVSADSHHLQIFQQTTDLVQACSE